MAKKIAPYRLVLEEFEIAIRFLREDLKNYLESSDEGALQTTMREVVIPGNRIKRMKLNAREKNIAIERLRKLERGFIPLAKKVLELGGVQIDFMLRPEYLQGIIRSVRGR